ncbi:alanine racemase [Pontibacillus salipaludis]|uniref:alanine racemase n=1 Tax=Pontibacillus salipaludis TaxID=1697394 RepID=UPI0031E5F272
MINPHSYRDTWADISLDALSHNVHAFKNHTNPACRLMAVVKADGYGHGAVEIAQTAIDAGADWLGVAFVDEGIELRKAGIHKPILLLGYTPPRSIEAAVIHDLTITIFTHDVLNQVESAAKRMNKTPKVHIKINSGMNRIGVSTSTEALQLAKAIDQSSLVELEGIFTHFADADNEDPTYTYMQFEHFQTIVDHIEANQIYIPIKHCANSATTIAHRKMHLNMVRVGVSLYGFYPSPHLKEWIDLTPVMTLKTKVAAVNKLEAGTPISYGLTFKTERPSSVATLPIGYADGLPRLLSNQGMMSIHRHLVPIVGSVCMDQTMIDVTGTGKVLPDDEVTVFGDGNKGLPTADEIAELTGTIHYEITCSIGKRVPRIYQAAQTKTRYNML